MRMRPQAWLLVLVFLIQQTPIQQICRAPKLFEHYVSHKQKQPELNFAHFLFEHYVTDDGIPGDNDQEKDLPFQSAKSGFILVQADCTFPEVVVTNTPIIHKQSSLNPRHTKTGAGYLNDILKPPKNFSDLTL